jgi:hypothetical protein
MTTTEPRRALRAAIWLPGLAVALGAAVATAHGLYEVAVAARVPAGIAWLYPLITDGLALVAYAATARLAGSGARYAWSVVILAAGLSGLAQAAYLAGDAELDASPVLRFGVGAWPAVAAAIVAHLLYLLVAEQPEPDTVERQPQPDAPALRSAEQVDTPPAPALPSVRPRALPASRPTDAPARDHARTVAVRHAHRHGALPSVRQLMELAEVSRGTAGDALKALRAQPTPLHLITDTSQDDTESTAPRTQP